MPGPLASAYTGIYRGVVAPTPAGQTGVWVFVPRLNGKTPMPASLVLSPTNGVTAVGDTDNHTHKIPRAYMPGMQIVVATLGGVKEDLCILGALSATNPSP